MDEIISCHKSIHILRQNFLSINKLIPFQITVFSLKRNTFVDKIFCFYLCKEIFCFGELKTKFFVFDYVVNTGQDFSFLIV